MTDAEIHEEAWLWVLEARERAKASRGVVSEMWALSAEIGRRNL